MNPPAITSQRSQTALRSSARLPRRRTADGYGSITIPSAPESKFTGFGGFPYPTTLLARVLRRSYSSVRRRVQSEESTLPPTIRSKLAESARRSDENEETKPRSSFTKSLGAFLGWNSKSYGLTQDDIMELGGVEYRALNTLLWVVAAVRKLFYVCKWPSSRLT